MHAFVTSLAAAAQGGRQPRHLALAVLVGFAAGAVCGWNLTFAALCILACWLNCRLWALPVAAACGFALAALGAPVMSAVGMFLLEKLELGTIVAAPGAGPLWAMFGLDDYRTLGALAVSLVVAVPAAHAVARLAAGRRSTNSDEAETPAAETAQADSVLRTFGFPAACCATAVVACLVQTHGRQLAADAFLRRASLALDLQLTADQVDYSLWTGKLSIVNLRVAQNDDPGRTALLVEQVDAETDPGLFLRGRFACSELHLAGVLCDAAARPRQRPGVFGGGPTLLKEDVPQRSHNAEPSRTVDVQEFVRGWNQLGERGAVVQQLVALVERLGDLETPVGAALQQTVAGRCAPRTSSLAAACPLVQVKRVSIERLPAAWRLSPDTRLELTHLTSAPATAEHFAQLSCRDASHAVYFAATFHLTGVERKHAVELSLEDVPAEDLLNAAAMRSFVELGGARFASIAGQGTATRDGVELTLCAALSNARVAEAAGPLAGLDAGLWRQSLAYLGEYRLDVKVTGRWNQLKLQCVPSAAVEQLKHQLRAAGAHELVRAVDAGRGFTPGTTAVRPTTAAPAAYPTTATPYAVWPQPAAAVATVAPATPLQPATSAVPPSVAQATETKEPTTAKAGTTALASTMPAAAPGPLTISPTALTAAAPAAVASSARPAGDVAATASTTAPAPSPTAGAIVGALNKPLPTSVGAKPDAAAVATKEPTAKEATTKTAAKEATATTAPAPTTTVVASPAPAPAANTPAKLNPAPATTPSATAARSSRPAIGVASDAPSSDDVLIAARNTLGDRYATGGRYSSSPAAAAPAAKEPKPSAVAPAVALRQPLSVLDPSAAPGPVNMSVGYTEERIESAAPTPLPRSTTSLYGGVPLPQAGSQRESIDYRSLPSAEPPMPSQGDAVRRLPGGQAATSGERPAVRTLPSQQAVPQPAGPRPVAESRGTPLPAENEPTGLPRSGGFATIPDNVESTPPAAERTSREEAPQRRGAKLAQFGQYGNSMQSQPRVGPDGKPVKSKGLLGGLNLFGGKKEEESAGEAIDLGPPGRSLDEAPAPQEKKSFPRLRSLFSFGAADDEIAEPDDGAAAVDFSEDAATAAGAEAAVRRSSYAAEADEAAAVRQAAPATSREPARMSANESYYDRMVR